MINWDKAPEGATHWHKNYGWLRTHYHGVDVYRRKSWLCDLNHTALHDATPYEKPKQEKQKMSDWLKPNIECEFNHPDFGWTECETIGWFECEMVCAPNGGGFYKGEREDFRPIKTEKEKWIAAAHEVYKKSDNANLLNIFAEIYDAGLAKL